MNTNSLPPGTNPVKDKIELTRLEREYSYRLIYLRNYYSRRGELQTDGSFFQTEKRLCWWLQCTRVGLMKARKHLVEAGEIRYKAGGGRGKASFYWILGDPEKLKKEPEIKSWKRPVLYPARAKELERIHGREKTIMLLVNEGYAEAEVIKACGEPMHGEELEERRKD